MVNLVKGLPEGWNEGSNGIIKSQVLDVGRLSLLLKEEFKDRLKFNLLTLKPELDGVQLPEKFVTYFYVRMGEIGWRIGRESARDGLIYASQQFAYDPVVEYLQDLELQEKKLNLYPADINNIATDYLNVSDELSNKMLKIWLVGQVKRAFERGSKHDYMLVLRSSEQGIGKSSFFRLLMPKDYFFNDTPCHNQKDRLMLIQTCWCYEIQELENLTSKVQAGEIKALLSSSVDTFRPPYGASVAKCPRGGLLVGTANKKSLIADPTGSRRFHFIEVEKINLQAVKEDRDSIWLSAIKSYREGFVTELTPEEKLLSENRNSEYQRENDFYTPIAEWIHTSEPETPFTTRQALIGAGLKTQYDVPKLQESVLVGDALRSLGFTQKQMRVKKHRDRYWIKSEKGGVSDDPKSESDNVTPKTTAIANDSGDCHNVTTNIEKSSVESNRTHRVVAGILGNNNVTQNKKPEKVVPDSNSTSQGNLSQKEVQMKIEEQERMWK